jgi:AcrR family transcriptional regulator
MPTAPVLGKRAMHRQARTDEFLKKSAEGFFKLGLRDATMDDIAGHVGVSKAVLYRYFSSKEKLLDSILGQMSEELVAMDSLPWGGYKVAIRRSLVTARKNLPAYLLLIRDARSDPIYSHYRENTLKRVSDRLMELFLKYELSPNMARLSAEGITAFIVDSLVNWLVSGSIDNDDQFEEWAAEGIHALDRQWRKQFGKHKP